MDLIQALNEPSLQRWLLTIIAVVGGVLVSGSAAVVYTEIKLKTGAEEGVTKTISAPYRWVMRLFGQAAGD